jgi:hypothetical protein
MFPDEELQLLDIGLKHNLHYKHKKWIKSLAIEADTAINLSDEKEQKQIKQLFANNIKKLIYNQHLKRKTSDYTIKVRNSRKKNSSIT